ncbi:MAG TPA: MBL fold metallo-hydrolase [Candidatus Aenigmarchaeota archaeon]|nr:MAG: hypothetical protein DRN75_01390 [Nanoarchaeota archaeon]HDO79764.1 MBL fold metallo-hydrolase [Candidatus Aenigmarchaeota archaeon]HEX32816.1 MBL fold metallo-hydrolase [Candidatus Aenigmarchaeota archaeon]
MYKVKKGLCNTYLFFGDKNLQVDAGAVFDERVDILVLTHCHYDHTMFAKRVADNGATVLASDFTAKHLSDPKYTIYPVQPVKVKVVRHGDIIDIGTYRFTILETPGHTKGSICLWEENKKILLSGDTLFIGGVGRTDLPSGDVTDLKRSLAFLQSLKPKLILPGH